VLAGSQGDSEVVIELRTSIGERRLKLGRDYRVTASAGLHAELADLLGHAILPAGGVDPQSPAGDVDPHAPAPASAALEGERAQAGVA
jgi:hypothetical protein